MSNCKECKNNVRRNILFDRIYKEIDPMVVFKWRPHLTVGNDTFLLLSFTNSYCLILYKKNEFNIEDYKSLDDIPMKNKYIGDFTNLIEMQEECDNQKQLMSMYVEMCKQIVLETLNKGE